METKLIKLLEIKKDTNRHFISEKFLRVQVIEITKENQKKGLFDKHKGELLIIAIKGAGKVVTMGEEIIFEEGDQVFINDGTAFRIESDNKTIVEIIWSPGLNN